MASGWNLWVWLVSVVRRYIIDILIIIITFPYSTCISGGIYGRGWRAWSAGGGCG